MARTKGYIQANGRYYAVMNVNGKRVSLGGFGTPEEATRAYRDHCKSIGRDPDRPPRGRPASDGSDGGRRVFSYHDLDDVGKRFDDVSVKLEWLNKQVRKLRVQNKKLVRRLEALEG